MIHPPSETFYVEHLPVSGERNIVHKVLVTAFGRLAEEVWLGLLKPRHEKT